jgi:hypothetical protein
MPNTKTQTNPEKAAELINENTICLDITVHGSATAFQRALDPKDLMAKRMQTKTNVTYVRAQKDLINHKEVQAIKSLDIAFKNWLWTRSIPTDLIRRGLYMVPLELLGAVLKETDAYIAKRDMLVEDLIARLPRLIQEAKVDLGVLFDPTQYPKPDKIRRLFSVDVRIIDAPIISTKLKKYDAKEYKRQMQKFSRDWEAEFGNIRLALRRGFKDVLDKMVDRLKNEDNGDGKRRQFRSAVLRDLVDFMDTFAARDVTGDSQLATQIARARKLLDGVDLQTLKNDTGIREQILAGFQNMAGVVNKLDIVSKSGRAVDLDAVI